MAATIIKIGVVVSELPNEVSWALQKKFPDYLICEADNSVLHSNYECRYDHYLADQERKNKVISLVQATLQDSSFNIDQENLAELLKVEADDAEKLLQLISNIQSFINRAQQLAKEYDAQISAEYHTTIRSRHGLGVTEMIA